MATAPQKGFFARFLPASGGEQFFDLFEQHAARSREAAERLAAMLHGGVDPEQQAARVKAVEHQGDEITHAVIERLHQTFITPIDRDDMHRLISRMDDVLDLIEASSERIWLYELRRIEPEARAFAEVLVESVKAVGNAVRGLRDLRDRTALIAHC